MIEERSISRTGEVPKGEARWCVLLVHDEDPLPASLLDGLRRRGLGVRMTASISALMVELARRGAMAVVVHQPRRWTELRELINTVHRYYPSVVCWAHEEPRNGGQSRLARAEDFLAPQATPESSRESAPRSAPSSRPEPVMQYPARGVAERYLASPLLSPEELAMLIGSPMDERDEDQPRHGT